MGTSYPVAGYRNQAARAASGRVRGFQTPRAANKAVEDLMRRAVQPPWGDRRGRGPKARTRLRPGEAQFLRNIALVVGVGARAHPAMRAAAAAWRMRHFLQPPMTAPIPGGEVLELNGWTECVLNCNRGTPTIQNQWTNTGCWASCVTNQAVSGQQAIGTPANANTRSIIWWVHYGGIASRWHVERLFYRTETGVAPTPQYVTQPGIAPMPFGLPAPMPMPWKLAPHVPNGPAREAGYAAPGLGPPMRAGTPGATAPGGGARDRRPGRREHERKFKLMSGGTLRKLVELAFEAEELVEIIHEALPKDCQVAKNATRFEQYQAIFNCYKRIDGCKLIEGVVNNQIEDMIFGAIGKAAAGSAARSGKAYGLAGITRRLNAIVKESDGAIRTETTMPLRIPKLNFGCDLPRKITKGLRGRG